MENILEVRINNEIFGFDAEKIEQILPLLPITPIPLSDKSLLGVSVINGKIINIIDLGLLIKQEKTDIKKEIVRVLTISKSSESFVVDEVIGITAFKEENFEKGEGILEGFYKKDEYVIQILNIENLLNNVKLEKFEPIVIDNLKKENKNEKTKDDFKRALFFKAGDERFALDIEILKELIFVSEITSVANSDALGIITLRDEVISLFDMNSLLGFPFKEIDEKSRIIIVYHDKKQVSFLVDEVEGVKNIEISNIEEMPGEIIDAIYKEKDDIVSVISSDYLRKLVREYSIEDDNEEEAQKENSVSEVAVFKIGKEEFAFDIEEVQEIIKYENITPIPEAPEFVEGVLNLRGAVIPVVNLPDRLGFKSEITDKTKIIICAVNDENIGFIVDDVSEILFVEDKYISKAVNEESLFDEVINLNNGERVILKIKAKNILDEETLENIKLIKE